MPEFRPERWMSASADEGGLFVGESPFKYAVFNAGRGCASGSVCMKMVAAAVLRRYRVVVPRAGGGAQVDHHLVHEEWTHGHLQKKRDILKRYLSEAIELDALLIILK
ncbi:Cytochrome P450 86A8 [Ananas comosus]|uniref:Cytochrome P450 86A8 n=1 Tax=Ananas comosus TaxID=4615 RepID=A0A199VC89_ANACO|nr:Cytochrome P450 86A8 [Ananas comosus]